jgi:hypothetical protein
VEWGSSRVARDRLVDIFGIAEDRRPLDHPSQPYWIMETLAFCSPQQQEVDVRDPVEFVCGVQSGEIFVRASREVGLLLRDPTASKSSSSGTLLGARPFVLELLGVGGESTEQHLVIQQRSAKIKHARTLRRQVKARPTPSIEYDKSRISPSNVSCRLQARRAALSEEAQWTREAIEMTAAAARDGVIVTAQVSHGSRQAIAWTEYVAQFEELVQSLRQHVAAIALRLHALLDSESDFIREWLVKEEAQCAALRLQTKLLYRFRPVVKPCRRHSQAMADAVGAVCLPCSWRTRRLDRSGCVACRWKTPNGGVASKRQART